MDRFSRVLRRVEHRLQAPEPQRSRILMEMAGDLEDLYRAYRERGLGEAEARRRAEQWLAPSESAMESLQSVHLPALDRLLDRFGATIRGRIELALVALASVGGAGAGAVGVLRSGALSASTPALWAVAGLVSLGLGIALRQGYSLFVRGDRLGPGWTGGRGHVLAASAGAALAGLLESSLRLSLIAVPAAEGVAAPAFWSQVSTASAAAALGLSGALLLALVWLLLRVRAEVIRKARAELRETVESLEDEAVGLETEVAS